MNQNAIRARAGMRSAIALASALALEGILFAICLIGVSSLASAAVINIPAITFVPRDLADGLDGIDGWEKAGVLQGAYGLFYAPLAFPSAGEVCSFSLVYRDNHPLRYVTATLLKKRFRIGQGPFVEPVQMAVLRSNGPDPDPATRRLLERDILTPKIDLVDAFYYVELSIGRGVDVVGVQVNYRPDKCPP